jgi:hypothetical protein
MDITIPFCLEKRVLSANLFSQTDRNARKVGPINESASSQNAIIAQENVYSSTRLGVVEELSKTFSTVGSKSADLDWALIAIDHPQLCKPNRLFLPASKAPENDLLLTNVAETMPDEGTEVLVATGTTGVITAISTISTCSLHLEGAAGLVIEAWTLQLSQIRK